MKKISLRKATMSLIPILFAIAFALPANVSAASGTPTITAGSSNYSTTSSSTSISFGIPSGNVWIVVGQTDRVNSGSQPACSVVNTGTNTALVEEEGQINGNYYTCLNYEMISSSSSQTVHYTAYGAANTNLVTIAALYITGFTSSPLPVNGRAGYGTCSSACTFTTSSTASCSNSCVAVGYGFAQPASGSCSAGGQSFATYEQPTSNPCTALIAVSTTGGLSGINYPIKDSVAPTQIYQDVGFMLD
jgi:hypothetical protein